MSGKGKEKMSDSGGKGKRKWSGGNDKTGGVKRKNRGVLQFFDDTAFQVDEDEDYSDSDEDDFEEEFVSDLKSKDEPRKVPDAPFVPKEEEMSEGEYERIMEERYKPGSGFVTYAEDGYEHKRSIDGNIYVPSAKDPSIWKVKCVVGRERYSAFCLMQKYVDMEFLGTKLPIISSFAPDHVKGFILIEADKQGDIYEACKGICSIYPSRVTPIPNNEFTRLLSVRNKSCGISKGMWARVKNGKYKGDLALVVAVNDAQKKVTVKLIPRIDLKAMAEKFGGGLAPKRTAIPPQRLISSSELDEFRPLIHSRRDRDTTEMVEVLDGVMLKDGYVYKKVAVDSLIFWGVVPTDDELLKFEPSKKDDSTDVQWLSQLFGDRKKEHVETVVKPDKGSGKSEGSTSASMRNNFEFHDLVFFGRKDFGVVVGQEKDDSVKVIKEGSDGPSIINVKQSDLKSASFDKKLFSALDQYSNTISINDSVRVSNGPLKDRQGIVMKIYKGILFLCDESEQENNGYICVKAQLCEKVNLSGKESHKKDSEPGPSGSADISLSPKSPLSPDNSCQEKGNKISFQQREDDGMFSVGQLLRIRVGPLKGYLCRALAIRRSDITVKLDSQPKILTVKSEHLSEVRCRNSAAPQGEETGSMKPFDFLATQDSASDWTSGAAVSTEGNKWNAGGSTERTSWSTFDSSNLLSKEPGSADDNAKKGTGGSSWEIKASNESSSWGVAAADSKQGTDQGAGGWGTTSSGCGQATSSKAVNGGSDSCWGNAADTHIAISGDALKDNSWGAAAAASEKQTGGGWNASGDGAAAAASGSQWGKIGDMKKDDDSTKSWGKVDNPIKSWDSSKKVVEDAPEENNQNDRWNKPNPVGADDNGTSWGKKNDISSVGKQDVETSWDISSVGKQDVETSWNKPIVKSWGKQQSDLNNGTDKRDEWGSSAKSDGDNTSGGGWNVSKGSTGNNIKSPGWGGGASAGNEETGNGGGSSSWDDKVIKPNESTKSSWKAADGDGSWKNEKNVGGGSPTRWGQSNWGKISDGNQESGWSSKGNWNSRGGFDESINQDNNSSNDRGRGGRWSGGRGGFQGGRGRSDSSGNQESTWSGKTSNWSSGGGVFGGNDSSSDRGRGGRGGRGDYRGRGGYDREGGGFRGRGGGGGFRGRGGRGGGDWNTNSGGNSEGWKNGGENSEGWKNGGGNSEGWKNGGGGGSWNQKPNDNNQQKSWGGSSWNSSPNEGGWKQGGGSENKTNQSASWDQQKGGAWNAASKDGGATDTGGWNNPSAANKATTGGSGGGWNNNNNGQSNEPPNKAPSGSWGTAPAASGNSSGNSDKSDKNNEGPSGGSWGKGPTSSSWGSGSAKW